MSHPAPNGPPDLTPIQLGEVWMNPVTRERSTILELPTDNPKGRAIAELTALVGARVVGEHSHPGILERFRRRELGRRRASPIARLLAEPSTGGDPRWPMRRCCTTPPTRSRRSR